MNWFDKVPSGVLKQEKAKARELRQSGWWKSQLKSQICHYCETHFAKDELTMDHKIPLIRGGKTSKSNCVVCCKNCNNIKGYKTLAELEMDGINLKK